MTTDISYSDILLEPTYSEERTRSDVDISSDFGVFKIDLPVYSANMPDITEAKMAAEMRLRGGLGFIHRFMDVESNVDEYLKANKLYAGKYVEEAMDNKVRTELGREEKYLPPDDYPRIYQIGVSIGVNGNDRERFAALYESGARLFCIDIAHGHCVMMKETLQWIRSNFADEEIVLVAGNVATGWAAAELYEWGADIIKVGIGPGCFVKGTKITCKDGIRDIEDVVVGDLVLTHRGRYKKVANIITKLESSSLTKVNDTLCTDNHEFYVVHKKYSDIVNDDNIQEYAEWIEASQLTTDYLLVKPHNK